MSVIRRIIRNMIPSCCIKLKGCHTVATCATIPLGKGMLLRS
jgi:hypothetical protein